MGALHQRKTNPVLMAEGILELLDKVPGARTVFIEGTKTGGIKLHSAKVNDPEPDKWRAMRSFHEVGTYTKGEGKSDLIGDLLETMARIR